MASSIRPNFAQQHHPKCQKSCFDNVTQLSHHCHQIVTEMLFTAGRESWETNDKMQGTAKHDFFPVHLIIAISVSDKFMKIYTHTKNYSPFSFF